MAGDDLVPLPRRSRQEGRQNAVESDALTEGVHGFIILYPEGVVPKAVQFLQPQFHETLFHWTLPPLRGSGRAAQTSMRQRGLSFR